MATNPGDRPMITAEELALEWLEKARSVEVKASAEDPREVNWGSVSATVTALRFCAAEVRRLTPQPPKDAGAVPSFNREHAAKTIADSILRSPTNSVDENNDSVSLLDVLANAFGDKTVGPAMDWMIDAVFEALEDFPQHPPAEPEARAQVSSCFVCGDDGSDCPNCEPAAVNQQMTTQGEGGEVKAYLRIDPAKMEPTIAVMPSEVENWSNIGYQMEPLCTRRSPVADGEKLALAVRTALDKRACPDYWMRVAYEAAIEETGRLTGGQADA